MSSQSLATVQEFNDAMVAGKIRLDLIDPDVVIVDHDIPDAGDYQGHEGLGMWLEDWGAAWESYTIEPESLEENGEVVLSTFTITARGRGSGAEIRRRNATVNTVKDGRVSRIEYYSTPDEARTAAGLEQVTGG